MTDKKRSAEEVHLDELQIRRQLEEVYDERIKISHYRDDILSSQNEALYSLKQIEPLSTLRGDLENLLECINEMRELTYHIEDDIDKRFQINKEKESWKIV